MKYNLKMTIKFLALIFFLTQNLFGQLSDKKSVNDLSDYELIQFISFNEGSPENIIKLDNNSEILFNCINGCTKENLNNKGIIFNESQLRLLKDWRLLKKEDNTYRTNFPILDISQTKILRENTKVIANKFGNILQNEIIKLKNVLKERNREQNIYSILFSYVIDGIWDEFEKKEMINEREVTTEHPFWDGEIWALFPKRDFHCGTNKISDKGIQLLVNWSSGTIKNMIPFVSDWKNLLKMFDNYVDFARVVDPKAKKVFEPFNLFNDEGIFTIPVIVENNNNKLFRICDEISDKIVSNVNNFMDLNALRERFHFKSNKQTLVIVYHEMMWDLLNYFENKNLITKPVAFSDPDNTKSEDISNLIFIVRSKDN